MCVMCVYVLTYMHFIGLPQFTRYYLSKITVFLQIFAILEIVSPSSESYGHVGYLHNYYCVFFYIVIIGLVVQTCDYDSVSCIFIPWFPCASVIYLSIFLLLALGIFMLLSIFSIKDHIEENVM